MWILTKTNTKAGSGSERRVEIKSRKRARRVDSLERLGEVGIYILQLLFTFG